jgi:hypothetical protein
MQSNRRPCFAHPFLAVSAAYLLGPAGAPREPPAPPGVTGPPSGSGGRPPKPGDCASRRGSFAVFAGASGLIGR